MFVFFSEPRLGPTTRIMTSGHLLHNAPEIKGIGIVAHDPSTWFGDSSCRFHLYLTDLGLVFFMVAMEYDARPSDQVITEQVIKVFIFFGEEGEERV